MCLNPITGIGHLQVSITKKGDGAVVGLAIVNTLIGGCGGGLTALFINKLFFTKKWSYLVTLNGTLTGMVSTCAGCNVYNPTLSLIIGAFGGMLFFVVRELMLW